MEISNYFCTVLNNFYDCLKITKLLQEMDWSEESEDEYDWDEQYRHGGKRDRNITVASNKSNQNKLKASLQPQEKAIGKFLNKIDVNQFQGPKNSGHKKELEKKRKDKADRATVEQVGRLVGWLVS